MVWTHCPTHVGLPTRQVFCQNGRRVEVIRVNYMAKVMNGLCEANDNSSTKSHWSVDLLSMFTCVDL